MPQDRNYPVSLSALCSGVLTTLKRHQNLHSPVYLILDEVTNYKIHGLDKLLTWGRSYGIRLHLIFQTLAAFEECYGKSGMRTLLSETEIKQALPGQREPDTLKLFAQSLLGKQAIVTSDLNEQGNNWKESYRESGRPLMTEDELRRTKKGILLVRQHNPIECEPVSCAEIWPWKHLVGINPFYGKLFKQWWTKLWV